uniref:Sulfotransferase domain-containing protein n=1 Tax=Alexandrium andersonii TaxID=327968 RepID=A0A7S2GF34_9DINO|mmetsp:Transcript_48767/g.110471  ORF Transcript_48767/g.110471 Transcript_48767/m.110471 type:complete len:363 (+) Transcript_48767:68-1156(+)
MDVAPFRFLLRWSAVTVGLPCALGILVGQRADGSARLAEALASGRSPLTRHRASATRGDVGPGHAGFAEDGAARRAAQGVRLLRIQKTGGSIFGDLVMKKFCNQSAGNCLSANHDDWSEIAKDGAGTGSLVTLLRDPVERIMSEFFWLRSRDGLASASRTDWDFQNKTWLDIVQTEKDVERALDVFLHGDEASPSRNRQTLYLLGFRNGSVVEGLGRQSGNGAPYAWDDRAGRYVRRALDHLEEMAAFGITDCWVPSMRAIARQLGWDANAVGEFTVASTPEYGKHSIDLSATAQSTAMGASFRQNLPREKIDEIERLNKVDLMLFRKALKRFTERFGEACSLMYEPLGPVMREPERKPAKR